MCRFSSHYAIDALQLCEKLQIENNQVPFTKHPVSIKLSLSGMPYGSVNLRYGVRNGETPVTCTAGVGTYIVEFGSLSRLTGDDRVSD